ncbi:MAG TPA: hypothetical protein VMH85_15385 [Terriglobales bacterium]|nr:hypothetical protein [Terriglobales bacterium]
MRFRLPGFVLLFLLWAGPAFAQGCAMCYTSAAGSAKEGQRAISRGVLVLLIPPLGFMTLGVGAAVRYGIKRDQEHNGEKSSEPLPPAE